VSDSDTERFEQAAAAEPQPEPERAPAVDATPAPVPAPEPDPDSMVETVPSWPFASYLVLWLMFGAVIMWRFYEVAPETPLFDLADYRTMLVAGISLTALGPVLSLLVWLIAGVRPGVRVGAAFVSAIFKGAITTFAGVLIWWATLILLDQLRFGSML
jgi:hypothetical protein